MRLYTSTQQEHHSPLFCTVADLQLMLHDSDLPCEAPGQPYFSSPVGFFKQWPPWLCRRRGAAGWPAHAEPANHAMSHRRLNHEPAPEKPSSPNALPQRGKQFLGTYPDRLDFSAATQVPWMWNASQCAWGPKGAWTQRPQSERLCGGVVLLHRIHHHEDLHMVAQALQSAMVILTRVFLHRRIKTTQIYRKINKASATAQQIQGPLQKVQWKIRGNGQRQGHWWAQFGAVLRFGQVEIADSLEGQATIWTDQEWQTRQATAEPGYAHAQSPTVLGPDICLTHVPAPVKMRPKWHTPAPQSLRNWPAFSWLGPLPMILPNTDVTRAKRFPGLPSSMARSGFLGICKNPNLLTA